MHRPPLALAVAIVAVVSLAGCANDARELRAPPEGAVSPTRSTASTALATTATTGPLFQLSSSTFDPGDTIPAANSCDGPSPALSWQNVPIGTVELALTMTDGDSEPPGFVHWVVTGIPPTPATIAEGGDVPGTAQANSTGATGYFGPCPPPGRPHTYTFVLYALPQPFVPSPGATPEQVVAELTTAASPGGSAAVTGTFGR